MALGSKPNKERPLLSHRALWYRESGLGTCPVAFDQDGQTVRQVDPLFIEVLRRCNGTNSIDAIGAALQISTSKVHDIIQDLNKSFPHIINLIDSLDETMGAESFYWDILRFRMEWKAVSTPITDNVEYHVGGIVDAQKQFDEYEMTVSHAFSTPHKALQGRSFGEAFCDRLLKMKAVKTGCRMLEIGCGTGRFATDFLNRLKDTRPRVYPSVRYTLFDVSPVLQESQKKSCEVHSNQTSFILGDVHQLDFSDLRYDLIICNEMIADLEVSEANRENLQKGVLVTRGEKLVARYNLDYEEALPRFIVNSGAIDMVVKTAGLLAPDGTCVITEYGMKDKFPIVVSLSGHNEYSIHFGHLLLVSRTLCKAARVVNLGDFLSFDGECEYLHEDLVKLLFQDLLPYLGTEDIKPPFPGDRKAIEIYLGDRLERIGNLKYVPLKDRASGITPFVFSALIIRG